MKFSFDDIPKLTDPGPTSAHVRPTKYPSSVAVDSGSSDSYPTLIEGNPVPSKV